MGAHLEGIWGTGWRLRICGAGLAQFCSARRASAKGAAYEESRMSPQENPVAAIDILGDVRAAPDEPGVSGTDGGSACRGCEGTQH